jgi:hypothetical protein
MASKVNIVIDQGTTFSTSYTIKNDVGENIDFTGYSGNSQMRKSYFSTTAYNFDVNLQSNGKILLSMSANTTTNITAGRYVYDIEVQDGVGIRSRVVEGIVTVTPEVTK